MAMDFRVGHGRSTDWREAAEACARGLGTAPDANLGFVYVADALAGEFDDIVGVLRARTGVETWAGTVGIGVCATGREFFAEPAVVALIGRFPAGSFATFDGDTARPTGPAAFGVVHADPRRPDSIAAVASLAGATGGFLVGGLASSRGAYRHLAGRGGEGGLSGVLFGEGVAVATGLTQGCAAIGETHAVTAARGNLMLAIDGAPAVEALAREIAHAGLAGDAEAMDSLHVAFPIPGSDTGDFLVRNLIGVDPESGALAVAHRVAEGDAIRFCRRDAGAARLDLDRMLRNLARRAERPRGALYFTCLARGPNLFRDDSEELRTIARALGEVPLAGFFGNGEISGGRLYTYTGVLAVFL
jgi:small ligand-binding sensory domain FIST